MEVNGVLPIEFSSDFIEETVFLTICNLERQGEREEYVSRFHGERNRCYEISGKQQQGRFNEFYLNFFMGLGLWNFFHSIAAEFVCLRQMNIPLFIRRVYGRKSEGAELFVRGSMRTVVTGLQTTRIIDLDFLRGYLRHEWMRISDMLDPDFKYDAHAGLKADHEIEENLNRDRFKILWDLSIASRLFQKGTFSSMNIGNLRKQFDHVFSTWIPEDRRFIYETVTKAWPISQKLLIDFSAADGHKRISGLAPIRCPLCHFTTYELFSDWTNDYSDIPLIVQEACPDWIPENGMCRQCFELFRSQQKAGHKV